MYGKHFWSLHFWLRPPWTYTPSSVCVVSFNWEGVSRNVEKDEATRQDISITPENTNHCWIIRNVVSGGGNKWKGYQFTICPSPFNVRLVCHQDKTDPMRRVSTILPTKVVAHKSPINCENFVKTNLFCDSRGNPRNDDNDGGGHLHTRVVRIRAFLRRWQIALVMIWNCARATFDLVCYLFSLFREQKMKFLG